VISYEPTVTRLHLHANEVTLNSFPFTKTQLRKLSNTVKLELQGTTKKLSFERFELRVMLSLCLSHVATVVSPFWSSVFHFLAKLSKICEIFFLCATKTTKLSLLHKNANTSSHREGDLMALTAVYQFEL